MRTPCRRLPGRHLRASNKPGAIHRTDVLYAMLRDGTLYEDPTMPQTPSTVALAA